MPRSPFGDYGSVDLSNIYATIAAAPPAAAAPVEGQVPAEQAPAAAATQMPADWGAVASQSYRQASGMGPGVGQNDSSPESSLNPMAYAGTVQASTLSPEQAAQIQYNTPEYQQFVKNNLAPPTMADGSPRVGDGHPGRDTTYATVNNLTNAYRSGAYAGDPKDLNAAIAWTVDQQYAEWISNFNLTPEAAAAQGLTKQKFVSQMGAFRDPTGPQPTLNGAVGQGAQSAQTTPGYINPASVPQYGGPAAPAAAAPAAGLPAATAAPAAAPYTPTTTATIKPAAITTPGVTNQADIAALDKYIASLSAVKAPTTEQTAKLADYTARRDVYQGRIGPAAATV